MMRRIPIVLASIMAIGLSAVANNFILTKTEQQQILNEADNWIDAMPDGYMDKLSDAVSHAMHGFYSEIEIVRNYADTTDKEKYKVRVENISGGKLGELSMRLYTGDDQSNTPLLIYFHGGGWSLGSLDTSDKFCRALASEGKIKVISVEYALAPENPYPNGLKQCTDAVNYIFTKSNEWHFDPQKVSLGGDGAGGNLALETCSNIEGEYKIRSLVLYYPMINTSGTIDPSTKRLYGRGYGFDSRLWEAFVEAYKNKNKIDTYGSLPPTLLIAAGRDILIEEEREFSAANPEIIYVEFEGGLHGYLSDGHQPTAFNKAVELTEIFLVN